MGNILRILTIIGFVFCTLTGNTQALKDTIFLNNGSVIIGKIKKVKLGMMTFDPDDAPDITVQMRKLRTVSSQRLVFRIETTENRILFGELVPHTDTNYVYVQSGNSFVTVSLEEISVLYPFENSIMQRLSGTVGIGFSFTKSSEFGRLNFDAAVNYIAKKFELNFFTSGIYTLTDSNFARDKEDLTLKGNYYFVRYWFTTVFLAYQRNIELGLQRRFQEGFGLGNKFIVRRRSYAWGRTGFVFNQEKNTEGVSTNTLAEIFGQFEFNFFQFANPEFNLAFAQSFYYSLSQSGRFRNDGNLALNWEVFHDFRLSMEFYHNYDSKPPVIGNSNIDFGTVLGLKYKF